MNVKLYDLIQSNGLFDKILEAMVPFKQGLRVACVSKSACRYSNILVSMDEDKYNIDDLKKFVSNNDNYVFIGMDNDNIRNKLKAKDFSQVSKESLKLPFMKAILAFSNPTSISLLPTL